MDIVRSRGAAAFGTRLRRLSERLDRELQAAYAARGLDFEPRWFAVVVALRDHGPSSVGELARLTGVSHAAVSQVRAALQARGLVTSGVDPADRRSRTLTLTDAGEVLVRRCETLWAAAARATAEMLAEHAPELLPQIDALEAGLNRTGLRARLDAIDPPERESEPR